MYKSNINKVAKKLLLCALPFAFVVSSVSAKEVRLGHAMPAEHPQAIAMAKFAEEVAKNTNKSITVQVFNGAVLGGDDKMLQAVQSGNLEFYIGGVAPLSGKVKEVQAIDFPFLFANRKEASDFYNNGKSARKILDKMSEVGITGLTWVDFGFRQLTNSKKQIKSIDDIAGLKIRVMQNPVALATWRALGANAVAMSFSEVFTALETKAIDGQENPLPHIYANRINEVQKFITITNHAYIPVALLASKKWFDTLTDAERKGITEAAKTAADYQAKLITEAENTVSDKIRATGVRIDDIVPAEMAKLRDKTKPIIAEFTAPIGEEFVKEFLADVEKVRGK